MEQKLERSPLRRLSPDGPQSERLAKQKLAQTEIVRKLLAHEFLGSRIALSFKNEVIGGDSW